MLKCTKSVLLLFLSFALVFFSAACTPQARPVSSSDIAVAYVTGPAIAASQELDVFITNMSQGCVEFPDDFGIKIYYQQNGSWTETGNLIQYLPHQNNRLESHGAPLDTTSISLRPDLSRIQIGQSLAFKAIIRGNRCSDTNVVVEKEIPFTVTPGK